MTWNNARCCLHHHIDRLFDFPTALPFSLHLLIWGTIAARNRKSGHYRLTVAYISWYYIWHSLFTINARLVAPLLLCPVYHLVLHIVTSSRLMCSLVPLVMDDRSELGYTYIITPFCYANYSWIVYYLYCSIACDTKLRWYYVEHTYEENCNPQQRHYEILMRSGGSHYVFIWWRHATVTMGHMMMRSGNSYGSWCCCTQSWCTTVGHTRLAEDVRLWSPCDYSGGGQSHRSPTVSHIRSANSTAMAAQQ